ncbi:AAA family ATPase [Streptomyces omiyaensis]|uniref:AAA family ATPase n=1 Tax=Streptomyces omiyaensis TaxID=68247 RepID=A0ABW7BWV6_9ACTN
MTFLQQFSVTGLLGEFNHKVKFQPGSKFVILHGPNGVGKTKTLELLGAVLRFDVFKIAETQFSRIALRFSEGEQLTVTNNSGNLRSIDLTFELTGGTQQSDTAYGTLKISAEDLPPAVWMDLERDIRVAFEHSAAPSSKLQALEHGGILFPTASRHIRTKARHAGIFDLQGFERKITDFLDKFSVHMVETQRLLILDRNMEPNRRRPGEAYPQRMKVSECAQDLANRLAAALTENSRISQERDKSFPRRVLDSTTEGKIPSEEEIRAAYAEQSSLRNRLAAIALLDESMDVPLQEESLVEWQRKVLWTYLEDSQKKLSSFEYLLHRVELFREIIRSRFQFKRMQIDRSAGFRFVNRHGDSITPSQLSSGEQHEIVLIYDLLFDVTPGSLVLIDEPEISLHVAWQLDFLSDIQKIADLSGFRFIVATHSPQIVNEWWDHTVGLNASNEEVGK